MKRRDKATESNKDNNKDEGTTKVLKDYSKITKT